MHKYIKETTTRAYVWILLIFRLNLTDLISLNIRTIIFILIHNVFRLSSGATWRIPDTPNI